MSRWNLHLVSIRSFFYSHSHTAEETARTQSIEARRQPNATSCTLVFVVLVHTTKSHQRIYLRDITNIIAKHHKNWTEEIWYRAKTDKIRFFECIAKAGAFECIYLSESAWIRIIFARGLWWCVHSWKERRAKQLPQPLPPRQPPPTPPPTASNNQQHHAILVATNKRDLLAVKKLYHHKEEVSSNTFRFLDSQCIPSRQPPSPPSFLLGSSSWTTSLVG